MVDPKIFGMFELFRMVRGFILVLGVAFYVRSEREVRLLILGLAAVVLYESLLAIKQRYLSGIHRVYSTFDESNSLSVFLCTTTPMMVAAINSRIPKSLKLLCALAIPPACVAELLTISRAGVIIIGLVLAGTMFATMSYQFTARKLVISLLVVAGATGAMGKAWKTLQSRFQEASLKDEYGHNRKLGRGYYLRVARYIAQEQLFGVGLNNWSYWVSNRYGPRLGYRFVPYKGPDHEPSDKIPSDSNVDEAQAAPAHCLGALTLGELGIPGFVLFTLLWLRWFQMSSSFLWKRDPDPMRRMGVGIFFGFGGMFLQSLTEWVFRHLPLYYVFHIMLAALMSLYYLKRQHAKAQALAPEPETVTANQAWA
jgi:hypothetical protein